MKLSVKFFLLLAVAGISLPSCKNDDDNVPEPHKHNEAELITTIKLVLTEAGHDHNEVTAVFKDADGDGGLAPTVFDTIRLKSSSTYNAVILLLDESRTPADTISNEVEEEGDEHQFFFSVSGGAEVTVAYADADDNGVPIGLNSVFTTGAATSNKDGKLMVVLKHQGDEKPKTGNGNADIGDTDVEVSFPIIIE